MKKFLVVIVAGPTDDLSDLVFIVHADTEQQAEALALKAHFTDYLGSGDVKRCSVRSLNTVLSLGMYQLRQQG